MLPPFFLIIFSFDFLGVCGAMFCFCFCFLFFVLKKTRHDFLSRHNFYYLINLCDCLFFLITCHFLILIVHHFITRVYE